MDDEYEINYKVCNKTSNQALYFYIIQNKLHSDLWGIKNKSQCVLKMYKFDSKFHLMHISTKF